MPRIEIPKEEYIAYVTKKISYSGQCKINEYIDIKYNKKYHYKTRKSKMQINEILNLKQNKKNFHYYHRLLQILAKDINFYDYFYILKFLKKEKMDDLQVYRFLQKNLKLSKKTIGGYHNNSCEKMGCNNGGLISCKAISCKKKGGVEKKYCTRDELFEQMFSFIFKRFFKYNNRIIPIRIPITNYLDIGCGDCMQTKVLGNAIDLPDGSIYGADLSHWGAYNNEKRNKVGINIIGLKTDGILPFESESFCLISAFMVLHHVEQLDTLLSEIARVLKPNGYFFIKEHDAMTAIDYMLCDIEHAMYDVVKRNDLSYFDTYYGDYYDWLEWDYILEKYGLKYVYSDYASNSINYNLTTNRSIYAIYCKKTEI